MMSSVSSTCRSIHDRWLRFTSTESSTLRTAELVQAISADRKRGRLPDAEGHCNELTSRTDDGTQESSSQHHTQVHRRRVRSIANRRARAQHHMCNLRPATQQKTKTYSIYTLPASQQIRFATSHTRSTTSHFTDGVAGRVALLKQIPHTPYTWQRLFAVLRTSVAYMFGHGRSVASEALRTIRGAALHCCSL
jgi:hypothetical protein